MVFIWLCIENLICTSFNQPTNQPINTSYRRKSEAFRCCLLFSFFYSFSNSMHSSKMQEIKKDSSTSNDTLLRTLIRSKRISANASLHWMVVVVDGAEWMSWGKIHFHTCIQKKFIWKGNVTWLLWLKVGLRIETEKSYTEFGITSNGDKWNKQSSSS